MLKSSDRTNEGSVMELEEWSQVVVTLKNVYSLKRNRDFVYD